MIPSPIEFEDLLGYGAALMVFAAFWVRSMVVLRGLAIASNVLFIAYAQTSGLTPVLILHLALLPLNILRLGQCLR